MNEIDWIAYYARELDVCDFDPASDALERHRCLAAWSVLKRRGTRRVLDVGCGDGFFCHWIRGRLSCERVAGVDASEGRLERARTRYPEVEYSAGVLPRLPYSDGEFDTITCIEVLEHTEDPLAALRELARVSSGQVVVTVPMRERLRSLLCPHCLRKFPVDGHLHSFDPNTLAELGQAAGLKTERIRGYSVIIGNLPWPFAAFGGWLFNLLRPGHGTFLAARFRK